MKSFLAYILFFIALVADGQTHVYRAYDNFYSVKVYDTTAHTWYSYPKNQLQVQKTGADLFLLKSTGLIVVAQWDASNIGLLAANLDSGYTVLSSWLETSYVYVANCGGGDVDTAYVQALFDAAKIYACDSCDSGSGDSYWKYEALYNDSVGDTIRGVYYHRDSALIVKIDSAGDFAELHEIKSSGNGIIERIYGVPGFAHIEDIRGAAVAHYENVTSVSSVAHLENVQFAAGFAHSEVTTMSGDAAHHISVFSAPMALLIEDSVDGLGGGDTLAFSKSFGLRMNRYYSGKRPNDAAQVADLPFSGKYQPTFTTGLFYNDSLSLTFVDSATYTVVNDMVTVYGSFRIDTAVVLSGTVSSSYLSTLPFARSSSDPYYLGGVWGMDSGNSGNINLTHESADLSHVAIYFNYVNNWTNDTYVYSFQYKR